MTTKHAYKVGDNVVVYNQTISGRTICEGDARVRSLCERDHTYMVQFEGEPDTFERRVEPAPASRLEA